MLLNPLKFYAPTTLDEVRELYFSLDNVKLQAGGTFLLSALKHMKHRGTKTPEHVICLQKVRDLKGISASDTHLTIKAMTPIIDLYESPLLKDNFSVFRIVCRNISTQQIRNMATVGGNLTCRYTWTEMPAVMVGLEATMHFIDAQGKEETLAAENFYKNSAKTDKLFTHVAIPRDKNCRIAYRRVKKSQYVDIPLLSLLIKTTFQGKKFTNTRVSVNNCVVFAQRDKNLENFLNQNSTDAKLPELALDHLDKTIYDTRSNDYKQHMFRVNIKDALAELIK